MRAEVILLSRTNSGRRMICLGRDTSTGEITAWGGGIKRGEEAHVAASRELAEESLDIINISAKDILHNSVLTITTSRTTAFFYEIPLDTVMKFVSMFANKHNLTGSSEMSGVLVMFPEDLMFACSRGAVYDVDAEVFASVKWRTLCASS